MAIVGDFIRRGTRGAQPAASTVDIGVLYFVTDEDRLERSNGTTWETYSFAAALPQSVTLTGTQHNVALAPATDTIVFLENATDLTVTGIDDAGWADYSRIRFESLGVGNVIFKNLDAGSAADHQIANRITGSRILVGGHGTLELVRRPAALGGKWSVRRHNQGQWIAPAYNAADYSWTVQAGDVANFQYYVFDTTLRVIFNLATTSTGAAPTQPLTITLPNSYVARAWSGGSYFYVGDGADSAGLWYVLPAATVISLFKVGTVNWTANLANVLQMHATVDVVL